MESNIWLRIITIGLVLSALAVGYFLLSGRITSNSASKIKSQTEKVVASASPTVLGQDVQASPTPSSSPSSSAFEKIAERNKSNIQTLPKTGFPIGVAAVFSLSAMISGWGLRKYPH